jgi:protein TonB
MRRSFTLFSIVAHAVVISAALVAQVLAVGALPIPHAPVMFDTSQFMPVDIQLPAPPRRALPDREARSAVSENAAPIVAPDAIAPESGREGLPPSPAPIEGVEHGPGGSIDTIIGTGAPPPPPPAAAVRTEPIRLHSGMTAPVKIVDVPPAYPSIAQTARIEGVVILEAVIDATGRVESVRVLRSIPLLDQAAVDAVRHWRFTPARLNGEAVPVVMTVTVNFTLHNQ